VITSPAPLASAINVTPAIYSDIYRYSLMYVIPSATYSSTVAPINVNIKYIKNIESGTKSMSSPYSIKNNLLH